MSRASNTFSVLQALAATVAIAVFLWSIGLPSLQFAEAANVTSFSNTLSDSAPAVVSNHTLEFTTPTGVTSGQTITLDFSDGPFVIGAVDYTDIDVATTSDYTLAEDCLGVEEMSAAFSGTLLTITLCAGTNIPANATTTIEIGTNATFDEVGDAQLVNPALGSRKIELTAGADTGETIVAIIASVTVNATVDTYFTFTIEGVAGDQTVNSADTTGGTTTAVEIPFGVLEAGTASTAAQDLIVETNARNGFVVTVETDQQLTSGTSDIDSFRNGNGDTTPTVWVGPSADPADENTWGHWGITSEDPTLGELLEDRFNAGAGGDLYVAILTTPTEVLRHTGPTNGTVIGEGRTRVGYKIEISPLQEAADDYTAILTYIATPVF